MGRLDRARTAAGAVVAELRREDVTFVAASVAYHAFVSMLPVLLLLVLAVSTFGSQQLVATVLELTRSFLPAVGQRVVTDALRNATGGVGLSVVGVVALAWGTSKIFRAMDAAFAEIYDTERTNSLLDQLRDALAVFVSLAAVGVGAVLLGSVVRVPTEIPFAPLLDTLASVLALSVAFFPIYYVFPDTDVSVRHALPGVVVAAVGWVGLKWLFHLYVSFTNKPDIYGLVGTLILLVTWLYAGSLVLLAGASVNATLSGRDGARRTERRHERQFGRLITDAESFERRLDELVAHAEDADVSDEEMRRVFQRRAESTRDSGADEPTTADGDAERESR